MKILAEKGKFIGAPVTICGSMGHWTQPREQGTGHDGLAHEQQLELGRESGVG